MPFVTVAPSIRTIPGVEEFDYRIEKDADIRVGDVLIVPFRKQEIPAIVISFSEKSAYADRARSLDAPEILLRGGKEAVELLVRSAKRVFVSRPTILQSWLREVPKRGRRGQAPLTIQSTLGGKLERRYLTDRWDGPRGLLTEAKKRAGRTLILTPWQDWANHLGTTLEVPVLHAGTTPTDAWNAIRAFAGSSSGIVVATRMGAWLSLFADTVLLDEPENDDYKQDEQSPRLDARWIVAEASALRPGLDIIAFGTTPRFGSNVDWKEVPDLNLPLTLEPFQGRSHSEIDGLSATALTKIDEALAANRPVIILHPVRGERARITCRDCGWQAICPACDFPVSLVGASALCRRCGKKSSPPDECPSCGGFDFSRSRSGTDRIARQIQTDSKREVPIVDVTSFYGMNLPDRVLVVLTDLALIGGAVEDIRRRERLVIATRRIAAKIASVNGELFASGSDEGIDEAQNWLTADGVAKTWESEKADRRSFGYPPMVWMAKILVDGTEQKASALLSSIQDRLPSGMELRGPFPVPFRAKSRKMRYVIHLVAKGSVTEKALRLLLEPLVGRAIIDLDPIAFFA